MNSRLFLVSAALLAGQALASEPQFRLMSPVKPLAQAVKLSVDPAQERYTGQSIIELEITKATDFVEFNGLDLTTSKAMLTGKKSCELTVKQVSELGILRGNCAQSLPAGKYTLTVDFNAPFNRKSVGLYKTIDAGEPYLFTQFEMTDARRAFPIFDEPNYKIPYQLTISAPKALKVYNNSPEVSAKVNGEWVEHQFAQTLPIPSYLVALAVGPFEEVAVKGLKIDSRVITPKGKSHLAQYAAAELPKILTALENYFGRPYPYAKLDTIAVPEFPYGAMENAGLVTYREDILLVDQEHASLEQKKSSASVIAHELAHQWYGNLVTMKWWNDLWLNEAFASWMASKVTKQLYPEFLEELSLPQNAVMGSDALLTTKPIRKEVKSDADIMDGLGLAYSKGSSVLSMIEQWIGEDAFQQGIQQYMKDHAFKNTEASDLWHALAKSSKQDVPAVLKGFIEQSSYPLITFGIEGKNLTLRQQRFANAGVNAPAQQWTVPVNFKYGKGNEVRTASTLLNAEHSSVKLDFVPEWIYPDADAKGYYRFSMNADMLKAVQSRASAVLNVRERLGFIANSNALLGAGQLTGGDYFAVLAALVGDDHPKVASQALRYINSKRDVFVNSSNEQAWTKFVQQAMKPALARYGLASKADDQPGVNGIRNQLLTLAGLEGKDPQVIANANQQTQAYLKDTNSVDAALIGNYLAIAAYFGDQTLFEQMQSTFETTKDPHQRTNLLESLGYFKDPALQDRSLAYLLTDAITASDFEYGISGHFYQDERQARVKAWFYSHYDEVAKKLPPFRLPSLPAYIAGGCDLAEFGKAKAFFTGKVSDVPGYARTLVKVEESVNQCAALRQRELASVNQYLNKF